jgi:hypothetical protein
MHLRDEISMLKVKMQKIAFREVVHWKVFTTLERRNAFLQALTHLTQLGE